MIKTHRMRRRTTARIISTTFPGRVRIAVVITKGNKGCCVDKSTAVVLVIAAIRAAASLQASCATELD
jgi:hypothetical protein